MYSIYKKPTKRVLVKLNKNKSDENIEEPNIIVNIFNINGDSNDLTTTSTDYSRDYSISEEQLKDITKEIQENCFKPDNVPIGVKLYIININNILIHGDNNNVTPN
jgi:hypothetical protein